MILFKQSAVQEPPPAGNASQELRLLELEKEREQVEEAFNESFRALVENETHRVRLAGEQARITARRASLLLERAALLKTLGRIR
jgi:hypothetical protein